MIPPASLRGRLLVAAPPLVDPNFDRTVVLVLEHGDEGALGIVLNRPTATELDDALPEWKPYAARPAVVFVGGPVAPDAVIALARAPGAGGDGWVGLLGDLGTIDVGREPGDLAIDVTTMRVFVGYAGWAPGQLEGELAQGAWFVAGARPDDPFASDPSSLWRDVLRRQAGRVRMFAHFPADPSVN